MNLSQSFLNQTFEQAPRLHLSSFVEVPSAFHQYWQAFQYIHATCPPLALMNRF